MTESSNNEVDRRKSFRLDMEKELVDITWTDENNQLRTKKIACLDFARGGLKIDCDQTIPEGTLVTVVFKAADSNSQKLETKVLRCIELPTGWYEIALILNIS